MLIWLSVVVYLAAPGGDAPESTSRAIRVFDTLQQEYWAKDTSQMWRSSMWWQSANILETVANLAIRVPSTRPEIESVIERVFNVTSNDTVGRCNRGVNLTFSGYFDDELWWGHGWLRAHVLTARPAYLNRSEAIFDDVRRRAWRDTSCGGGVCWQASRTENDMKSCYKNAITSTLFVSLAAQLGSLFFARCASGSTLLAVDGADCARAESYAAWANKSLSWFVRSGTPKHFPPDVEHPSPTHSSRSLDSPYSVPGASSHDKTVDSPPP